MQASSSTRTTRSQVVAASKSDGDLVVQPPVFESLPNISRRSLKRQKSSQFVTLRRRKRPHFRVAATQMDVVRYKTLKKCMFIRKLRTEKEDRANGGDVAQEEEQKVSSNKSTKKMQLAQLEEKLAAYKQKKHDLFVKLKAVLHMESQKRIAEETRQRKLREEQRASSAAAPTAPSSNQAQAMRPRMTSSPMALNQRRSMYYHSPPVSSPLRSPYPSPLGPYASSSPNYSPMVGSAMQQTSIAPSPQQQPSVPPPIPPPSAAAVYPQQQQRQYALAPRRYMTNSSNKRPATMRSRSSGGSSGGGGSGSGSGGAGDYPDNQQQPQPQQQQQGWYSASPQLVSARSKGWSPYGSAQQSLSKYNRGFEDSESGKKHYRSN